MGSRLVVSIEDLKKHLVKEIARIEGRPEPKPGDCPFCGKSPPFILATGKREFQFTDARSRAEHQLSGMCQPCQNDFFKGE